MPSHRVNRTFFSCCYSGYDGFGSYCLCIVCILVSFCPCSFTQGYVWFMSFCIRMLCFLQHLFSLLEGRTELAARHCEMCIRVTYKGTKEQ